MLSFGEIVTRSYINEMAQQIPNLSSKDTEGFLIGIYEKTKDDMTKIGEDIYLSRTSVGYIPEVIFMVKDGELQGGVFFDQTTLIHKSRQTAYVPKLTVKINTSKVKGFMYLMYSTYSKYKGYSYIMSDDEQTKFSKKQWLSWFKNKRNISDIFLYNKTGKVNIKDPYNAELSWCESDYCKDIKMVVKFE